MPHLVEPIRPEPGKLLTIQECLERVVSSRDFLVARGGDALQLASEIPNEPEWGSRVKRVVVDLQGVDRPGDIGNKIKTQTITEVINQTANLARLIDLMRWIILERTDLNSGSVKVCHPTTSSGPRGGTQENDLSLVLKNGTEAHFEVSDVSGDVDGNDKEFKSLVALRCLPYASKKAFLKAVAFTWPKQRMFIAVSRELAKVIDRTDKWWRAESSDHLKYNGPYTSGNTRIFEVIER